MKRRDFFAASAVAGLAFGATGRLGRAAGVSGRQLLELRLYHFASAAKQQAFDEFLARAAVPALNRAGIKPVGVFRLLKKDNPRLKLQADSLDLYVLLPHNSIESLLTMIERLAQDGEFLDAAGAILDAPKSDPAYLRYESSLMLAFESVPKVEVPTKAKSRLLQLRTYESHNTERALMKIQMFNEGGELATFRRCGMNPVFFGQSLIGSKLPNLTYMLSFESKAAQDKAWKAFLRDPAWLELKNDETYKDTVSNITNLILRPGAGSQI